MYSYKQTFANPNWESLVEFIVDILCVIKDDEQASGAPQQLYTIVGRIDSPTIGSFEAAAVNGFVAVKTTSRQNAAWMLLIMEMLMDANHYSFTKDVGEQLCCVCGECEELDAYDGDNTRGQCTEEMTIKEIYDDLYVDEQEIVLYEHRHAHFRHPPPTPRADPCIARAHHQLAGPHVYTVDALLELLQTNDVAR